MDSDKRLQKYNLCSVLERLIYLTRFLSLFFFNLVSENALAI
jgi:hypothetical protein